jgi:hypothetical protein
MNTTCSAQPRHVGEASATAEHTSRTAAQGHGSDSQYDTSCSTLLKQVGEVRGTTRLAVQGHGPDAQYETHHVTHMHVCCSMWVKLKAPQGQHNRPDKQGISTKRADVLPSISRA